ncbi:hypothetical protein PV10_06148 [Exophiala mesophila]|uniref:Nitrogen regulatory protein areA GATA-like domain-containing protein n=1 Tax=Exophiala mesophila TaxID=212818 RepID=A0A0D1ZAC7_EXOME|nr:uncharacterized protein PV10_06148 [Exophiala mesophila]KIV91632.1 hypothetical protein PV10_06148 [Exophiala mesophila]
MAAILPQGLIHPPPDDQLVLDTASHTDNQDILRRFWRVYSIQSHASHDDSSSRASNLFWRVWSSPNLSRAMPSTTLTRLLHHCGQAFELTPIADSMHLPRLGSYEDFPPGPRTHHAISSKPSTQAKASDKLLQQPQSEDTTSGSTSQNTSESSSRPSLIRSTSGGRSRHSVSVATGKSRSRPQPTRRKSSTPKLPHATMAPKSPLHSPRAVRASSQLQEPINPALNRLGHPNPPPGLFGPPGSPSASTFALPSASSWQSDESAPERSTVSTTVPPPPTGDLVDPGFRGKFVENQKKSSINLAGLNRMRKIGSVVRFADEEEIEGKGKEREAEPFSESGRRLSQMTTVAHDDSGSSTDEDQGLPLQLPRTKSQLSLLIKHKRDQTGSQDLGPQSPTIPAPSEPKEKSKEAELLSMGRRDGVTKAGGIQVPRQQRLSDNDPSKSSIPSSPDRLF